MPSITHPLQVSMLPPAAACDKYASKRAGGTVQVQRESCRLCNAAAEQHQQDAKPPTHWRHRFEEGKQAIAAAGECLPWPFSTTVASHSPVWRKQLSQYYDTYAAPITQLREALVWCSALCQAACQAAGAPPPQVSSVQTM